MKFIKLFESYQTQKDLEYLTTKILYFIAEKTILKLKSNIDKISHFERVILKDFNPSVFGNLSDFVKQFRELEVIIISKEEFSNVVDKNSKAVYLVDKNKDGSVDQRLILLIENDYTLECCNRYVAEWDYDDTNRLIKIVAGLLGNEYKKSLIHELQHAFDDWRSKGKYKKEDIRYKDNKPKFNKLMSQFNIDSKKLKKDEIEFITKHQIDYLNIGFEVDARFTTAIQNTIFYETDFDKSIKEDRFIVAMRPFKKVLSDFKSNLYPFVVLTPENKRKVLRKFGQFYELEKEFIKKKNKDSEF